MVDLFGNRKPPSGQGIHGSGGFADVLAKRAQEVRQRQSMGSIFQMSPQQLSQYMEPAMGMLGQVTPARTVRSILKVDNPGGRWLQGKIRYAEEAMDKVGKKSPFIEKWYKEQGLTPFKPKPKGLSQTGMVGGTTATAHNVMMDPRKLNRLPGVHNEETFRHGSEKFYKLKDSVEKQGWNPEKAGEIHVMVNHKGEAYISEGNHRVAVAAEKGVPRVKVYIQYYNGAENVPGPFNPDVLTVE